MELLYIDPGSGSMLFQALLSGILTIAVFFKRIVAYIKFRFGGTKHDSNDENIDFEEEKNKNENKIK